MVNFFLRSLAVVGLLGTVLLPADTVYNVSVSTAAYAGQSGYLDFQLGRGPDSQSATVTVENFAGSGSLSASGTQTSGGVAGALPGPVTLTNSGAYNDYFQSYKFGSTLTYTLLFSGPAINAPNGTSVYGSPFAFGLYDSAMSPLGANDGLGDALIIQISPRGSTTPTIYNNSVKVAAAVPEPATFGLTGSLALLGLIAFRRHR